MVLTTSCVHDADISSARKIAFSDIKSIVNNKCGSCHGIGKSNSLIDSAQIVNLVVPFKPFNSELYTIVTDTYSGNFMPPLPDAPLNNDQRTKIYLWILQGADTKYRYSDSTGVIIPPQPVNDSVSFVSDILPIFVSNCSTTGCHDAITRREGYNLSSYSGLLARGIVPHNSASSRAYTALSGSGENLMPPPPRIAISATDKAIILKWINEGAKNTNFTNNCDTTKFTFTDINPIIQASCVGCHNAVSAGGGIQLTTYGLIKTIADNGRLLAVLTANTMPKGAPLGDCKKIQIRKWVTAGSLQN
jgi:uncharacterized membrane protein